MKSKEIDFLGKINESFLEEVTPVYLDQMFESPTIASPERLYRANIGGIEDRYYYKLINEGTDIQSFISITSAAKHLVGDPAKGLQVWRDKLGSEMANFMMDVTAREGTLSHIYCFDAIKKGYVDFEEIARSVIEDAQSQGYGELAFEWASNVCNAVACFVKFWRDKNCRLVASEFAVSDERGVAGQLDVICEMDFNRTRVKALLDLKRSSLPGNRKRSFQLQTGKSIWNRKYGDIFPITHVFNIVPKKFYAKSPYALDNFTKGAYCDTIDSLLALVKPEGMIKSPKAHLYLHGKSDIDKFQVENHVISKSVLDRLRAEDEQNLNNE